MRKAMFALVLVILAIIFLGSFDLVKNEFLHGDICPKILNVPACYIIISSVIIAFVGHVFNLNYIFFLAVIPSLLIASYGSLGELFGFAECPRTASGIPMCFISFGLFASLTIAKIIHLKLTNRVE